MPLHMSKEKAKESPWRITSVRRDDTDVAIITRLLDKMSDPDIRIKRLYLDRGFFSVPVIRRLLPDPSCYDPLLRFFRAASWDLEVLLKTWGRTVVSRYPLIMFNGRLLLIGDGIKVSEESLIFP